MKTIFVLLAVLICHCRAEPRIVVSVPDQRLAVVDGFKKLGEYQVSTAHRGIGFAFGSKKTPLGEFRIVEKIGDHLPLGTVFNHRVPTRKISHGGAGILTRILRLAGCEPRNANTEDRGIYIHGAPDRCVGVPHSIGCIGMRSVDVVRVFEAVSPGTVVQIFNTRLVDALRLPFLDVRKTIATR
jgi:L,D-transpeptidase-like protein